MWYLVELVSVSESNIPFTLELNLDVDLEPKEKALSNILLLTGSFIFDINSKTTK